MEGMQGRCLFGRGDAKVIVYLDEWMKGRCFFERVHARSFFIWSRAAGFQKNQTRDIELI
jgi:hypothetical protein